jgi:hypothetical protein
MSISIQVRETIASLLHQALVPLMALAGASSILQENPPQEIAKHLSILYESSNQVRNNVRDIFRDPDENFDLISPAKSALQLRELSSQWKEDIKIISNILTQLQEMRLSGFRLDDAELDKILENMPKALRGFERYLEYFSKVEEKDLLHWDNEKILRLRHHDDT